MTTLPGSASRQHDSREVHFLGTGDPGFHAAMRLVLCGDPRPAIEADRQVELLLVTARRQKLSVEPIAAAYSGSRLLMAALVVESPGRTGLLYLPPMDFNQSERASLTEALIPAIVARAADRGLVLLQALVRPHDRAAGAILDSTGFTYLTELVYMVRRASAPAARRVSDRGVQWVTFDETRRDLFISALEESYIDSLDCRGLGGLRRTTDVLEGHRATGIHDPAGWYVARMNDATMGVILTAQSPGRASMEVVYMGVSPAWRGKGVGDLLLARAVQRAQAQRLSDITLAVDGINIAARRLYDRWSFVEGMRRRAWITQPSTRS